MQKQSKQPHLQELEGSLPLTAAPQGCDHLSQASAWLSEFDAYSF